MAKNSKKMGILKKAVKNCGKGGPGWDAIKNMASSVAQGVSSGVNKAEKFVSGRFKAMGDANQERVNSYYTTPTPIQTQVLQKYKKLNGQGGPGSAKWQGKNGAGDNTKMADLTKILSNVKIK